MPRLLVLPILFSLSALALAQSGGLTKVVYIDKKTGRVKSEEGEVRESVGGVKVVVDGKEKLSLTPAEVVRVEYAELAGIDVEDRGTLLALESERDPAKARAGFAALKRKAAGDRGRKYLEFRELQAAQRAVDAKAVGDEFKKEAADLAEAWGGFAAAYSGGWEVWPATRTRARLLADLGDYAKAAETLTGLAKINGLPAELRSEAALARCEVLLRGGLSGAAAAVDAAAKDPNLPAAGPLRERAVVYQAWAAAPRPGDANANPDVAADKIQAALDAAKDPAARAAGFNAKGDLLLAFGRPKDARWEFLWVETVYNHDKDELANALRRLVEVFDALGDRDRADQYREKLRKVRG
jgi:hypothetical protein